MRLIRSGSKSALTLCAAVLINGCGGGGGGDVTGTPPSGPPAAIAAVTGAPASVVAGAATPIPLTAKVTDAAGKAVAGVVVTWTTQSGSITPGSATTDASGQSAAQWTPGTVAGSQSATATVSGVGSTSFPVTISAAALAKIKLSPDTLRLTTAGQTGVITVAASDAFDNFIQSPDATVTFTTDNSAVATVSSTGTVTAVANGTTAIHATAGSATGAVTVIVNIPPPAVVCTSALAKTLAVGEAVTLSGTDAASVCLQGASGSEFVAVPFYGAGSSGTSDQQPPPYLLNITPVGTIAASGPPTPTMLNSVRLGALRRATMLAGGDALHRDLAWESRFRERTNRDLRSKLAGLRAAQRTPLGGRNSVSLAMDVVVGQTLSLNVQVNGNGCTNTPVLHSAIVKAVSNSAIVAEDTNDPTSGGFTDSDYQFFAAAFDTLVMPVDTTNFGQPTDLDQNGNRTILFFTTEVNRLTPASENGGFVGGFFYSRDLFPKTIAGDPNFCPGSNFAEMFYLLAPDPAGTINNHVRSTSLVRSITVGTVAHEFQHLINAAQHLWISPVPFTALESTFLDEGLAHEAEELTFYRAAGLSPRTNIGLSKIGSGVAAAAFSNYQEQNARRFREYLKLPKSYSPYSAMADTSLAVRGAIWSFLRYAADRKGGDETAIWKALASPATNVQGIRNLQATFGSDILSQIHDWATADYTDDRVATVSSAYTHPSWNTPEIESFVNAGTFPLLITPFSAPLAFNIADGGAAFLRFGLAANSVGGATVTSSGTIPSSFSITVVRTK